MAEHSSAANDVSEVLLSGVPSKIAHPSLVSNNDHRQIHAVFASQAVLTAVTLSGAMSKSLAIMCDFTFHG